MKYQLHLILIVLIAFIASTVSAQTVLAPGQYTCDRVSLSNKIINCPTPTPVPTPSPSPKPTPSPTIAPTPSPIPTPTPLPQTINISSPQNGSTVLIGQPWFDNNSATQCKGVSWYTACYVDNVHIADIDYVTQHCQIPSLAPGSHQIQSRAHTANPNGKECAVSNIVNVLVAGDPTPTATTAPTSTPKPSATPTPATAPTHFVTLGYRSPTPTESTCASMVAPNPTPERTLGNVPFNNPPLGGVPSSFYNNPTPSKGDTQSVQDFQNVTGNFSGSTDDIMRWAACKYGVDEDIVRAQGMTESTWRQGEPGDIRTTQAECINNGFSALWNSVISEPNGDTVTCNKCCYQSWSLWQTKVYYETTSWPMMMESTPFAADFRYADQRSCMNGDYALYFVSQALQGNPNTYASDIANFKNGTGGDKVLWGCVGMHYSGGWYDSGAQIYITETKKHLSNKDWLNVH